MTTINIDHTSASEALARLIEIAMSDTGQSARVANFLLAWWNGDDWGHFPIADIFGLDRAIGIDITVIIGYLADHPGAVYADAFGQRKAMSELVDQWRAITPASV